MAMKVMDLMEALQKCNPSADVVPIVNGLDMMIIDVKLDNPASSVVDVELIIDAD